MAYSINELVVSSDEIEQRIREGIEKNRNDRSDKRNAVAERKDAVLFAARLY